VSANRTPSSKPATVRFLTVRVPLPAPAIAAPAAPVPVIVSPAPSMTTPFAPTSRQGPAPAALKFGPTA
jgi:hypothetical protein